MKIFNECGIAGGLCKRAALFFMNKYFLGNSQRVEIMLINR